MFTFRLALALGKTVGELESVITPKEMSKWMDYYQAEPFGQWRDNWHMARIGTILANRYAKRGVEFTVDDFMFKTIEQQREHQTRQTLAAIKSLAQKKPNPES